MVIIEFVIYATGRKILIQSLPKAKIVIGNAATNRWAIRQRIEIKIGFDRRIHRHGSCWQNSQPRVRIRHKRTNCPPQPFA